MIIIKILRKLTETFGFSHRDTHSHITCALDVTSFISRSVIKAQQEAKENERIEIEIEYQHPNALKMRNWPHNWQLAGHKNITHFQCANGIFHRWFCLNTFVTTTRRFVFFSSCAHRHRYFLHTFCRLLLISRSLMLLFDYGFQYLFPLRLFVYLLNAMHVLRIHWLWNYLRMCSGKRAKIPHKKRQSKRMEQNERERTTVERERVGERERKRKKKKEFEAQIIAKVDK